MTTLERDIKKYLLSECKRIGALAEKFTSYGRIGVPDWLITYGGMYLVELKKPEGKLAPHQLRDHSKRAFHGVRVWVVDSKEKVDKFINAVLLNREFEYHGLSKRISDFEDLDAF